MGTGTANENKVNCLICGQELVYAKEYADLECVYCGKTFSSNVSCRNGHYICDACHSSDAVDLMMKYFEHTDKTNPIEMAIELMKSESVHMHGPEHHFLVPGALITSYMNVTGRSDKEKKKKLLVAKKRAEDVKGGFCGFYGSCGAAIGTGIFMSVINETTPLSKETWSMANEMTGMSLINIAKSGSPRCCKRCAFTAIRTAAEFVDKNLGVKLYDYENNPIVCEFMSFNKECIGLECSYHPVNNI
jgi:hypothetical protein